MKCTVTGCAGFIGSNLVDRLLALGHQVVGIDNFSTGKHEFLEQALKSARFALHDIDLAYESLTSAITGCDVVFHLAANADVRLGLSHPTKDLEQNVIVTSNVLEAMRTAGVKRVVFSSTGSVYGEAAVIPTPEDVSFPVQTSLYGASKLAAEGLISAYCQGYGFSGLVFRFVSILGERYTHGHVVDFYRQLKEHPGYLNVLGDGTQRKSYLYVQDCVDAVLLANEHVGQEEFFVANLGTDEVCSVKDSVMLLCKHMGLSPEIRYSGGPRGWVGDNPFIHLRCDKMRALGWCPKLTIKESLQKTFQYLEKS